MNYRGYEQADSRMSWWRQLYLNIYGLVVNIPAHEQWVDFRSFDRIKEQETVSKLSEGNVDL